MVSETSRSAIVHRPGCGQGNKKAPSLVLPDANQVYLGPSCSCAHDVIPGQLPLDVQVRRLREAGEALAVAASLARRQLHVRARAVERLDAAIDAWDEAIGPVTEEDSA